MPIPDFITYTCHGTTIPELQKDFKRQLKIQFGDLARVHLFNSYHWHGLNIYSVQADLTKSQLSDKIKA